MLVVAGAEGRTQRARARRRGRLIQINGHCFEGLALRG
jgi:hypothetical protein